MSDKKPGIAFQIYTFLAFAVCIWGLQIYLGETSLQMFFITIIAPAVVLGATVGYTLWRRKNDE